VTRTVTGRAEGPCPGARLRGRGFSVRARLFCDKLIQRGKSLFLTWVRPPDDPTGTLRATRPNALRIVANQAEIACGTSGAGARGLPTVPGGTPRPLTTDDETTSFRVLVPHRRRAAPLPQSPISRLPAAGVAPPGSVSRHGCRCRSLGGMRAPLLPLHLGLCLGLGGCAGNPVEPSPVGLLHRQADLCSLAGRPVLTRKPARAHLQADLCSRWGSPVQGKACLPRFVGAAHPGEAP